jgi:hypothetical protein
MLTAMNNINCTSTEMLSFHQFSLQNRTQMLLITLHKHTVAETIMLTAMNNINCTSTEMLSFHQFSLQNRTQMLLITLHKHTVAAHGISITCSFLITMQHTSTHSRKRKQTNIHTASHIRLQLPSPHGRKENTPTFHTVAAHGLLQLQLDTQGNRSHQLMA